MYVDRINYWNRKAGRVTRRRFVAGTSASAAGLAGLLAVGCGDDDDDTGGSSGDPSATTATGTGTAANPGTPRQGGNLVFTDDRDPDTFDPMFGVTQCWHILSATNSTLLGWKHGEDVRGFDYTVLEAEGLAESYEQVDDTTLLITLRDGVKFHDKAPVNGRTLTAEDVKYTFDRWIESKRSFISAAVLSSVRAVDERTVEFKTNTPYAPFLGWLATPAMVILAPEAGKDGDHAAPETVVGTGAFMFDSYQAGVRTKVVRNPDFFKGDGRPYIDSYEYKPMSDLNSRQAAVRTGEVDIGWFWWQGLPTSLNSQLLRDNGNLTSRDWTPGSPFYVAGKADKPPFNDPRVRQAVSLGIDRKRWIELLAEGEGSETGAMPFIIEEPWYLSPSALGTDPKKQFIRTDKAEAKALLDAAGYGDGIDVENYLTFSFTGQAMPEAEFIAAQLQEIGIKLSINQLDYATFAAKRSAGELDFAWTTHTYSWDFDPMVYSHWHSTGAGTAAGNTLGINDPDLDRMLDKQRTSLNNEERLDTIHEIQRYNAEQCYTVYEVIRNQHMPYPKSVHNFGPHAHFDLGGQAAAMWRDA
jgi:peptide/nickel transport system substrate-binding protein